MKDLIDERNFKEQCARSIVKSYNVHYLTEEEIRAEQIAKEKQMQELHQVEEEEEEMETISDRWADMPSANYGKHLDTDPVTQEQIEQILGEREEKMYDAIEEEILRSKEQHIAKD